MFMETTQYTEARTNWIAARERMDSIAKWGKAKRDAAEEVEFWGNRLAFLGSCR